MQVEKGRTWRKDNYLKGCIGEHTLTDRILVRYISRMTAPLKRATAAPAPRDTTSSKRTASMSTEPLDPMLFTLTKGIS